MDRLLAIVAGQHVAKLLVALHLPKEVIGQIDERTRGIHERHCSERRGEHGNDALEDKLVEVGQAVAYDENLEQLADEVERRGHIVEEQAAMHAWVCGEVYGREVAGGQACEGRAQNEADERVVERIDNDETVESDAVYLFVEGQYDQAEQVEDEANECERRDDQQDEAVHGPSGAKLD